VWGGGTDVTRRVHRTVPRLRWAVTIGYTVAGFTAILVAFLQPWAPQMIDLDVYRAGASAVLHGTDPYRVAGPFGLPFTYPIFAAMVFVPLALLPELVARAVLTVASFAALIVICHVSLRQLAPRLSHHQAALISLPAAVLAVFAHPVLDTLSFGQINLILAAMVLADVFLITGPGRGVLVGLAAGIKLTPGLFIVYYLVTGKRREAWTAAFAAAVTVLAGFAVQPRAAWAYWSRYLLDPGRAGGVAYAENQSILAVTARLLRTPQPPSWLTWALSAVVVIAAAVIARLTNRAGDELTAVSVIAAAALLASPISWTHHWVWFLPATAAVAAWCHRAGGRWRWWLLVAAACVFWIGPMRFMPKTNLRELAQTPAQQLVTNSFALLALVFLAWAGYTVSSVGRGGPTARADPKPAHD
jgi:alpha-1,2-mannosyltransferase